MKSSYLDIYFANESSSYPPFTSTQTGHICTTPVKPALAQGQVRPLKTHLALFLSLTLNIKIG